ncbi:hypothetical protein [Fibrobacter sp. UWB10]|uniref:hypothetical protein n=1 Tax=Fibrobacter sp. UWB10 TaxID=1896201 RepID=UPI002402F03F|nr:hypothetical protein [Fibrobacter sp. UWB10]SMP57881.1 hypothetical protein SAMN05720465_2785 [Fibrobacter sp. UWB10]
MFKIERITFFSTHNESYDYTFEKGLNYFIGGNNTGKTEFYNLIDFMFGHEMNLSDIDCYKNCISRIQMDFVYNNVKFSCARTLDIDKNFLFNASDGFDKADILSNKEYRTRLNKIFAINDEVLRNLEDFAEEGIGFRTFTMFNFLDEKNQGQTQNFLSKCSSLKYSLRLSTILNYIFNKNLEEIKRKEQKLNDLLIKLSNLNSSKNKSSFIINIINENLQVISPSNYYTGKNTTEISEVISKIKNMSNKISQANNRNIADLVVMYNSISEQVKKYKNEIHDITNIKKYDNNRIDLLSQLKNLSEGHQELEYLISPIRSLLNDLDDGISFDDYIIKDETVKKLEKQLEDIKREIKVNDSRFKMYSLEEKEKSIAIIEEYLKTDLEFVTDEQIADINKSISSLKRSIRELQNLDDVVAIDKFSNYITELYTSLKDISSFVQEDLKENGFRIKYIKNGNVLQPVKKTIDEHSGKETEQIYHTGSMARHIVIQLCGYAAFLRKLLTEKKSPIIPFFVIDHISKPFDEKNCKAIGKVIFRLLDDVGEDNLQIFMFDSEQSINLGIDTKYQKNLVTDSKTGLCPFFGKS